MATDFGVRLATRLKEHPEFWHDLNSLQAGSVWSLSTPEVPVPLMFAISAALPRLMYSASVFSQVEDEETRGLAQTIALCSLTLNDKSENIERAKSILATVGNYPVIKFLENRYNYNSSDLLSNLRLELLKSLNSVEVGGVETALTEFQNEVWRTLPTAASTAISAPTSAGKSFLVIEHLCRRAIESDQFTAVYIAPTRALLYEIQHKIESRLGEVAGVRVSTVPSLDAEMRRKQIFVLTQERLQVLLSISSFNVDLLVVDEAQALADGSRGMILQDCLERLREENPTLQLVLLAPGAEGFSSVAKLLDIQDLQIKETRLSPVQQNRVQLKVKEGESKSFTLSLLTSSGSEEIGEYKTERGLSNRSTRLAAAALELGKTGGSLVYATGPVESERIAAQLVADIPDLKSDTLNELAKFIREHIHPEYGLAAMVQHGVSFHYGQMPRLLREALEEAFRNGYVRYLVCTTTLFQGVNLPARSVFINTPTRGSGTPLDAAHLWNFAGRAGRLGHELAGNVFLVDYDEWSEQAMGDRIRYRISPAFSGTLTSHFDAVASAVSGEMPPLNRRKPENQEIRAAAGLLLARASRADSHRFLMRVEGLSEEQRESIQKQAVEAVERLALPAEILEANWTVNPYGLRRLADNISLKVDEGEVEALLPVHPTHPQATSRYSSIINRTLREITGKESGKYAGLIAGYAVPWMEGRPYPVLLSKWVNYERKKNPKAKINDIIRRGFEFFEQVLRFQMVQMGKAYLDVLHYVLDQKGMSERRAEAFDFSLALELGVSSTTGRSLVELGLSRIAATVIEGLYPDSALSVQEARKRLWELDIAAVSLAPLVTDELRKLRLIPSGV
jgi:superfamily II DNA/RNA helicase